MMKEIKYPSEKTWFIANSGNTTSNGVVDTDQCMVTGLDSIETFTEYSAYLGRCAELGIEAGE